jgi:hypothetical protein
VRDRLAGGELAGSTFSAELDLDCGNFAGSVGWIHSDIQDGLKVFEERPVLKDGLEDGILKTMESFSDEDFKRTIWSALRLLVVVTVVAVPLVWWKLGWQSAVLLLVGAVISGSGLWEWLRLMTAVMVRMDGGEKARPMGMVLFGFFLRLGLTVVLLYVSLKILNGSVYALAAGLALGVFALTIEGLRLMKAWTV